MVRVGAGVERRTTGRTGSRTLEFRGRLGNLPAFLFGGPGRVQGSGERPPSVKSGDRVWDKSPGDFQNRKGVKAVKSLNPLFLLVPEVGIEPT